MMHSEHNRTGAVNPNLLFTAVAVFSVVAVSFLLKLGTGPNQADPAEEPPKQAAAQPNVPEPPEREKTPEKPVALKVPETPAPEIEKTIAEEKPRTPKPVVPKDPQPTVVVSQEPTIPEEILLPTAKTWEVSEEILATVKELSSDLKSTTDVLKNAPKGKKNNAERWQSWYHALYREAYQNHGQKGPWDADAVQFLTGYVEVITEDDNAPDRAEVLALGNQVLAAGCEDALILSAQAYLVSRAGNIREARRLLEISPANEGDQYPDHVRFAMRVRGLLTIPQKPAHNFAEWRSLRQKTIERAREHLANTLRHDAYDDGTRRVCSKEIEFFSELLDKDNLTRLAAELTPINTGDRWLQRMALARTHSRLGWINRGSGSASRVSVDRWKSFRAHILRTRALLLEAWHENPNLPESSITMMQTLKTFNGVAEDPVKLWFHQALQADFEEPRTYDVYRWTLQRRWGGGYEEILELGRDCLNSNLFETKVPYQYHLAVNAAMADARDPKLREKPQIYTDYKRLFEGYAQAETPERKSFHESQLAAITYLCGRPQEAEKILTSLGESADPIAFHEMGVNLFDAWETIRNRVQPPDPFSGHEGDLNGIALLKKGLLVTASSDGTAKIWDFAKQREVGSMSDHLTSLSKIRISNSRDMVATGDLKGRVIVWSPELERELHTFQIMPPVWSMAFSKGDRLLATGGGDGHVRVWDLDDGRLAATLPARGEHVGSLSFSGDGLWLASTAVPNRELVNTNNLGLGPAFREVSVWNLKTLEMKPLEFFRGAASQVEFMNQGQQFAVAGRDETWAKQRIHLANAETGREIWSAEHSFGTLQQLMFSPDDRRLYAGSITGDVFAVDAATGKILAGFHGHEAAVRSLTLSVDGKTLVTSDMSGQIFKWDVSAENLVSQSVGTLAEREFQEIEPKSLRHGHHYLAIAEQAGVSLWDSRTDYEKQYILDVVPAGTQIHAMDISADDKFLAVLADGSDQRPEVTIVETKSKQAVARFSLRQLGWASEIRLIPGEKSLAITINDRIELWDFEAKPPRKKHELKIRRETFVSIDVTTDGKHLIASSREGRLVKWNMTNSESEEIVRPTNHLDSGITQVRVVPNSPFVVTGSTQSGDVWNHEAKHHVTSFKETIVAPSRDGRFIAVSGRDKEVRVHDAQTGKLLHRLIGASKDSIHALAWSSDGQLLFSANATGKLRRWNTQTARMILKD